jgi:hypothetical protein
MVLVILQSGLLTRPFTLFSSIELCKYPLYVIWVKKVVAMNGLQVGENGFWGEGKFVESWGGL